MERRETPWMHKYSTITNDSNYDSSCTLRHCRFMSFRISGSLIFGSECWSGPAGDKKCEGWKRSSTKLLFAWSSASAAVKLNYPVFWVIMLRKLGLPIGPIFKGQTVKKELRILFVTDSVQLIQRVPYRRSSCRRWKLQNRITSISHSEIRR